MKNTILLFLLLFPLTINAQTYVPDNNFEQALIDLGYDSGSLDDYVSTANINSITSLNISNKGIADLTGIEDFTALAILLCNNNNLSSLNVTQNPALTYFYCNSNNLSSLDVTQNPALKYFYCDNNNLSSLDVTQNQALNTLVCNNNKIGSLDVTQNPTLILLICSNNNLINFPEGLENLQLLQDLIIDNNNITGCWPANISHLCNEQLVSYNFNDNNYDGVTNFISNQGWLDLCNTGAGSCCLADIMEECTTGPCILSGGTYTTANTISYCGEYVVKNGEEVFFYAPQFVKLSNGFSIEIGAEFEINMEGCMN